MASANGDGRTETSTLAHVAAAERLAASVVSAFESCEEAGVGLSEVQKIAVIEAILLQFDGFAVHLAKLEKVGWLLDHLGQS
jgi:hypothetical protein